MILPPPHSTLFPYTTLFRSPVKSASRAPATPSSSRSMRSRRWVSREPHSKDSQRARGSSPLKRSTTRRETTVARDAGRSEEHTSELQSRLHLVCRLLLEKKK